MSRTRAPESLPRVAARTGQRPATFAYPYGGVDDRVETGARAAGFTWAVTTELRPLDAAPRPLRLPRLDAYYLREGDGLADWGRPAFRARLALRGAMRRARAALTGRPA